MSENQNILDQFKFDQEKTEIDVTKKVRVGIIGTGWIAEAHAGVLKRCPDVEIVALADIVPGKAEAFAARKKLPEGIRFYNSGNELIDNEPDLDVVSVCTYNTQHAEPTIYALQHGIHVLLEKPFTVTLDEAIEIMKAEKESGKICSVGFQPRGDENMKMVRKIVQSGELGEIYYIQTGGGRRRGVPNSTFIEKSTAGIGAMGDIGCYSLDVVLNAIDYPKPLTVSGYTSGFFGANPKYNNPEDAARFNVEDFAAAFVHLEGGIILDFRISWAMHPDTPGDTIIFGKEGALRIPSTDCWNGSMSGPMTIYHDVAGEQVETIVPLIENKGKGLFYKKCRSFLEAIANGDPAPIPTSQILYNQAIIDHIVKSAELGKEVEVVIPEI